MPLQRCSLREPKDAAKARKPSACARPRFRQVLEGTGSDAWTALWESARRFSQEQAYPDKAFPVVEDGAQCVLCQQDLDHAAAHRLKQFEAFVASTTERELRQIRETFARLRKPSPISRRRPKRLTKRSRRSASSMRPWRTPSARRSHRTRTAARPSFSALTEDKDLAADCAALVSVTREAEGLAEQIEERDQDAAHQRDRPDTQTT